MHPSIAAATSFPGRRIRVLHLRVANFYGGPERQIHLHAAAMVRSGYELRLGTFLLAGERPEWIAALERDGIPTVRFRVRSSYDPRAVKLLHQYVWDEAIDIVCSHDYRSTILWALALRGTRARWIAFSRGTTRESVKIRAYWGLAVLLLRAADAVVAVSADQASRLRRLGLPNRKIHVVRNAVEPAAFDAIPAFDVRARNALDPTDVVCVSVGRFSPEKGQRILVEAAALALEREPRLRFVLYGDGPDLAAVRDLVASRNLGRWILCPGFERDAVACIKGADLFVHPSLLEGLPNVILEAMAVGTPVVAAAIGGIPEIIQDGVTGLLASSATPGALAQAILRAVEDRGASVRRAAAARDRLGREFSFAEQARRLAVVYERVIAGGRRCGRRATPPPN